ncbi:hypothetical protein [Streptomyces sp. NPDC097610]
MATSLQRIAERHQGETVAVAGFTAALGRLKNCVCHVDPLLSRSTWE